MSETAVTQASALPPGSETALTDPAPGRAAGRRGPSWRRRQNLAAYAFLSPWLVGLAAFTVGPMIASLVLSFTAYDLIGSPSTSAATTTPASSRTTRCGGAWSTPSTTRCCTCR